IRPWSPNSVVTLTATSNANYVFTGWEVANHGQPQLPGVCPGTAQCVVTMDQAKDVVALFTALPPPTNHSDNKGLHCDDGFGIEFICCDLAEGGGELVVC